MIGKNKNVGCKNTVNLELKVKIAPEYRSKKITMKDFAINHGDIQNCKICCRYV